MVLRIDCGQLPDAHPAVLSLSFLNRKEWENKMQKLVELDKDREANYQFPSRTKETSLGENEFN